MSLVLLPGLGADSRLFDHERETFPDLIVPDWIPPRNRETLRSYARRLSEGAVSALAPQFLGGASFGGMIALEMARWVRPKAVFLIGSCRSPSAIPRARRVLGRLLSRLPTNLFDTAKSSRALLAVALGPCRPQDAALARRMAEAISGEFLRWGFSAVLDWEGCEELPSPVYQIHGSRDRLLPLSRVTPDAIVAGGGHLLTLTHPEEVDAFLAERMSR